MIATMTQCCEGVGLVQRQVMRWDTPLALDSGAKLAPVTLAYETYGKLNADRSNAILICHALSGDSHVAGYYTSDYDEKPGWWDDAVGPMLAPNYPNWFLCTSVPAGQKIEFKFIKIASNGAVTWEAGANHTFTVPTSGTGFVNVNWQY